MSNSLPVIKVRELGKMYKLGATLSKHTLRDSIAGCVKSVFNTSDTQDNDGNTVRKAADNEFWALNDVSLDVYKGDVLGIIGGNGAGKSTLLKIISQITQPSCGEVRIRGRVASLLEVGTGFHSELSGRENIYMNGSILGMSRSEIKRRFDDIVEFSGVEKFLDTPVKRYSSGMYVRLAFAVAAHLEPEILVVDEVLAVGDAEFQKKCLGKMEDVAGHGRTVIFVSHNMQAVKRLCSRGILLDHGRIVEAGTAASAVEKYLLRNPQQGVNTEITPAMHSIYPADLEVHRVEITNRNGEVTASLLMDEEFTVNFHYMIRDESKSYRVGLILWTLDGTHVATVVNTENGKPYAKGKKGLYYQLSAKIRNILLPGTYVMDVNTKTSANELVDSIKGIQFSVLPISTNDRNPPASGIVSIQSEWSNPQEAHEGNGDADGQNLT